MCAWWYKQILTSLYGHQNGLPAVNFSRALLASGQEFVEGSWEQGITGGPFYQWPVVFAQTKTTMKVKPICNGICAFSVFWKKFLYHKIPLKKYDVIYAFQHFQRPNGHNCHVCQSLRIYVALLFSLSFLWIPNAPPKLWLLLVQYFLPKRVEIFKTLQVIKETSRSCVKNCEKFLYTHFSMVLFHTILDCTPLLWNKQF